MKKFIAIDVDGVLTNGFVEKASVILNEFSGENLSVKDIIEPIENMYKKSIWEKSNIDYYIKSPGYVYSFEPFSEAIQFVEWLKTKNYDFKFVTAPYNDAPVWMHERERWLMKHFNVDRNHVIFARDKTVIRAVTLIDDNMGNCVEWAHHNSRMAILFAQPWNNREEIFSHCKTLSAKKHHESERFLLVNSDDKKIIAIERSNNWDDIKDTISHIMSRA